jgi:uncharacterized protein (TIGR02421 family)
MGGRDDSGRIPNSLVSAITTRLGHGKRVRRTLPAWGRLHVDRQLPFLVAYRRPSGRDDAGTERLVLGEASYLRATGKRSVQPGLRDLVRGVAEPLAGVFGTFLIVEIWSGGDDQPEEADSTPRTPGFRIFLPNDPALDSTVNALESSLTRGTILGSKPRIERVPARKIAPPGLPPLSPSSSAEGPQVHQLGLEVRPLYRDPASGQVYPRVLRAVQSHLSRALKQAVFEFTTSQTTHLPPHYQALGRRAMVKAVWRVDGELAEISNGLNFLLYVTPANPEEAWRAFKRKKCEVAPEFVYRPLPIEPVLLKRKLYQIPVERVEDPVIFQVLSEKQLELDRKLTMLADRGTREFLWGSLQLFGTVSDELAATAEELLERLPLRDRRNRSAGAFDARAFARRAEEEIAFHRRAFPEMSTRVEIRRDMTGLMVSNGNLMVGESTRIPASRVEALIQHEIGTHVLTSVNGKAQPLKLLSSGLAGYDEFQEGLAVLAEYLCGGITASRMRLLAARVLAVRLMLSGATFIDTFRALSLDLSLDQRSAFVATMRVFRGGGFTKDATYLRGLIRLIDYLRKDGDLDTLFVGKIAEKHVPVIRELRWRDILKPPLLRPRYLDESGFPGRLAQLRSAIALHELVEKG